MRIKGEFGNHFLSPNPFFSYALLEESVGEFSAKISLFIQWDANYLSAITRGFYIVYADLIFFEALVDSALKSK
ncbi:hypothetical protein NS274_19360 [Pseudomonas oryzihabitans]|nr:hypothetical protein NS274_19360 [Pseudomonas psychrotolerans]KTT03025.1 hypothetical protein NS376_11935 [Pseudomonas psychrotolerans]KTT26563.1 hypothetical protein SB14R_01860 [Pseudomonas psychrotolerans]KTT32196.1 hypothetical protein NS201_08505 [Pseudomonas psychrotolerans]KTT32278.1 hypothetical protein SB9_16575 [Pseudomonas psychrotolerans]